MVPCGNLGGCFKVCQKPPQYNFIVALKQEEDCAWIWLWVMNGWDSHPRDLVPNYAVSASFSFDDFVKMLVIFSKKFVEPALEKEHVRKGVLIMLYNSFQTHAQVIVFSLCKIKLFTGCGFADLLLYAAQSLAGDLKLFWGDGILFTVESFERLIHELLHGFHVDLTKLHGNDPAHFSHSLPPSVENLRVYPSIRLGPNQKRDAIVSQKA